MNTTNNEMNDSLKKIISENNYTVDYKNYYMSRMIKFLLNFILLYCLLEITINPEYELSRMQLILLICVFSSVLMYILDSNFPSCIFVLN